MVNAIGLMVIFGVGLFIYASGANIGDLLTSSRFSWFGNDSFSLTLSAISAYMIALTPAYIYLVLTRGNHNKWFFVVVILATVLYGVLTKDRKWIFYLLSGWLAARYQKSGNRITLDWRSATSLSALFVFLMLSQFIRDALPRYLLNENYDFESEFIDWLSYVVQYSDFSYFYRATIEAIHQNIENNFYITLGLVRRVVFFFLPAGFSGGLKTEDMSAIFSDLVGGEDALRRGSMPPGLFGLFVLSFGWIGAVGFMPLLALLVGKLDSTFRARDSLVRVALVTIYVTSVVFAFRGDESTAFYFAVANVLMLSTLGLLARIRIYLPKSSGKLPWR
jgi:hypothetical protein